jgi:hypothetical protein
MRRSLVCALFAVFALLSILPAMANNTIAGQSGSRYEGSSVYQTSSQGSTVSMGRSDWRHHRRHHRRHHTFVIL